MKANQIITDSTSISLSIDEEKISFDSGFGYGQINSDQYSISSSSKKLIFVHREAIDYNDLQSKYGQIDSQDVPFHQQMSKEIKKKWGQFSFMALFLSLFPIFSWLPKYSLRNDFLNDFTTGFTISILHIPQGIAYAILAGLDPIIGLYISFFPVLIYSIMGTSKHTSIGSFAVVGLMINAVVNKVKPPDENVFNDFETQTTTDSLSTDFPSTDLPPSNLEIVTCVCLTIGFIQIAMGIFRLGSFALILSDHLISGFTTAVALYVATSQFNNVFGIRVADPDGSPLKLIMVNQYINTYLINNTFILIIQ